MCKNKFVAPCRCISSFTMSKHDKTNFSWTAMEMRPYGRHMQKPKNRVQKPKHREHWHIRSICDLTAEVSLRWTIDKRRYYMMMNQSEQRRFRTRASKCKEAFRCGEGCCDHPHWSGFACYGVVYRSPINQQRRPLRTETERGPIEESRKGSEQGLETRPRFLGVHGRRLWWFVLIMNCT